MTDSRDRAFITSRLFLTILSLVSSQAVFAENFAFRMTDMPTIAATECDDVAFAEGKRLQKFIGTSIADFKVTDARCVAEEIETSMNRWNIEISYDAAVPLSTVSSLEGALMGRPGFKKREDCEAQLVKENLLFTKQTKLPVFAGYCRVPLFRDQLWEAKVVGFGSPTILPFNVACDLAGSILGHTTDSFTAMIRGGLAKVNAELSHLNIQNHLAYATLGLRYYGPEEISLEESKLATFIGNDECAKHIALTQTALTQAGVVNFGTYCHKVAIGTNVAELASLTDYHRGLFLVQPDALYNDYATCESSKAAVVKHYITDLKRDIKAGYCSRDNRSRKYQVVMIEKRTTL